jgi:hypothetical protein
VRVAVTLTAVVLALAAFMPGAARAGIPPPMTFSPTFWATAIHAGTSTTKEFTLTNAGGSATGVLTLATFPSGPFTISADGCTGVSLGPDKSCNVTVQYAPVIGGTDRASLTASSKKGSFTGVSLTGISWLTGAEACDQLGGTYGTDDEVDYYNDRAVNWTCNDWAATSDAGPLLSRACQFTPPGTTAFITLVVAEIGDATCYGSVF